MVASWFKDPGLRWSICAFTESGFLRVATAPRPEQITMKEASSLLDQFAQHPGYRYLPIDANWQTLCSPFFPRLYGTRQVTDAYLLGLAVRSGSILVTLDKAILHLAGPDHAKHVLVLKGE